MKGLGSACGYFIGFMPMSLLFIFVLAIIIFVPTTLVTLLLFKERKIIKVVSSEITAVEESVQPSQNVVKDVSDPSKSINAAPVQLYQTGDIEMPQKDPIKKIARLVDAISDLPPIFWFLCLQQLVAWFVFNLFCCFP